MSKSHEPLGQELVVALFDVLGFEDRLRRFSLEEIHGQYKELISIASTKGSHAFLDARPVGDGTSVPFIGYVEIEQDYFSDKTKLGCSHALRTHAFSAQRAESFHFLLLPSPGSFAGLIGEPRRDARHREFVGASRRSWW
jgi:hypothetical protein